MVQLPHKVKGNMGKTKPQHDLEQPRGYSKRRPSGRIVDIDELVADRKPFRQVISQRLHSKAFRGVMAGREVVDAALARNMDRLFRNFAADKGIQSPPRRRLDPGLRRPGAPAHGRDPFG